MVRARFRWALPGSAVLVLGFAGPVALAMGPDAVERMAHDRRLAQERCRALRDYTELTVADRVGDTARAKELDRRSRSRPDPATEELNRRYIALVKDGKYSAMELALIRQSRERLEAACPYEKEDVPREIPPAQDDGAARDYVRYLVPRTLAKMRICEVMFPERVGILERTWAASRLSRLDMPEIADAVRDVRGWMRDIVESPVPASRRRTARGDPRDLRRLAAQCEALPGDLRRIEAALPSAFLSGTRK